MTVVDLLRHGELEGGVRYRGQTDDALTRRGRERMDRVWKHLAAGVEIIVSSPLSRCAAPAQDWAAFAGIPLRIEPRLAEMHYGAWEGLSREEIDQRYPGQLRRWRENPVGMRIPGAEDFEAFARRVTAGWEAIISDSRGMHVLVVAHSGSLRVILTRVLGAPLTATRRLVVPYASWSRVVIQNSLPMLEFLNADPCLRR